MQNTGQRPAFLSLDQHMHMAGHHTLSQQPITLTIPMQQSILDYVGNGRLLQPARPVPCIKKAFDLLEFFYFITGFLQ